MSYNKIPAGNDLPTIKYEVDKDSDAIFVDRFVATPMFYPANYGYRSEEHTSELQSRSDLVCRLLLEKKKKDRRIFTTYCR